MENSEYVNEVFENCICLPIRIIRVIKTPIPSGALIIQKIIQKSKLNIESKNNYEKYHYVCKCYVSRVSSTFSFSQIQLYSNLYSVSLSSLKFIFSSVGFVFFFLV